MHPKHALLAIIISMLWGLNYIALKYAAMAFPPFLAVLIRFALTTLILSPWLFKIERRYLLPAFFLSFVMSVMYFGALFKGLQGVPAGEGNIIGQLGVPISALLSAVLLKDKIKRRLWLAICICIFGVTLTVGMPERMGNLLSVGFLFVGAILWAVNNIQMKCLSNLNPLTLNGVICGMSLPILLILVLIFEPGSIASIKTAGTKVWFAMGYMVLVSTVFCYSFWFWLMKKYPVSKLAPFCLIAPVAALLGAHVINDEALSLHTLFGTAILLCGLALIVIKRDASAKVQDTEKLTDK